MPLGTSAAGNLSEDALAKVRNRQLGFVFQDFLLLDGLTVRENILLPAIIGAVTGYITGKMLRHTKTPTSTLAVMLAMLLASAGIGFIINSLLPTPVLNFMLIGMSFPLFSPI